MEHAPEPNKILDKTLLYIKVVSAAKCVRERPALPVSPRAPRLPASPGDEGQWPNG